MERQFPQRGQARAFQPQTRAMPPRRPPARPQGRPPQRRATPASATQRTSKPIRRDRSLLMFDGLRSAGLSLRDWFVDLKRSKAYRGISFLLLASILVVFGFVLIAFTARPDTVVVNVNGEYVGAVQWSRGQGDIQYIITHTQARLENQFETRVVLRDDITLRHARPPRGVDVINFDTMVTMLAQSSNIYVYGANIVVDGLQIVSLQNLSQGEEVLRSISQEGNFKEEVRIITSYINIEEVTSAIDAYRMLTTSRYVLAEHQVQRGQSFYSIARMYEMTRSSLFYHNPDLDPDGLLREGQMLTVTMNIPIISVYTPEYKQIQENETEEKTPAFD